MAEGKQSSKVGLKLIHLQYHSAHCTAKRKRLFHSTLTKVYLFSLQVDKHNPTLNFCYLCTVNVIGPTLVLNKDFQGREVIQDQLGGWLKTVPDLFRDDEIPFWLEMPKRPCGTSKSQESRCQDIFPEQILW